MPEHHTTKRATHANPSTSLIHRSRMNDPHGSLAPMVYQSTTFVAPDLPALASAVSSDRHYTRYDNPNFRMVEATVAELERAEEGVLFASGMAAISSLCFAVLKPGDHIVVQEDLFGGTTEFINHILNRLMIRASAVPLCDVSGLERSITADTRLVMVESPSNPLLRIADLRAVADVCRQRGVLSLVDNTFASPINQNPLEFGIDVVVHSATKYLGGHSDVVAGVVCGRTDLMAAVRDVRRQLGGVLDPHAAVLLLRGLRTLALRVAQQNESAHSIASALAEHDAVATVNYPFLDGHSQAPLARSQMRGGGGMISLTLKGGAPAVDVFTRGLRLFLITGSLGGVESLVTVPALTSHARVSREQREALGITDGLIRLSVGIEDPQDLLADITDALAAVSTVAAQSVG